ncbi:MAG: phosphatase PAP2 family protein [Bacteroidales bacterium]|jgi:hypothetical protein|nr:phosphatase PAP2 family protein [Bacteroidales bacterium]
MPLCFAYALKSCGVKSKSSWGKLITTTSLSTIIGLSTCHLIKNKSSVKRPDNSSNNSFPSGHTTMAFISASILDKEYGETSYWYSFGGYSVAAITGLSRVANNRHWISDVLCGAGLGILSTELSYFITDAIFKDKYSSRLVFNQDSSYNKNPSFANLYTTYNYSFNKYTLKDNSILRFYDGASLGIEGTYFFSPYFGIGTLYDISNYRISTQTISKDTTLNIYSSYLGSYFSYPLFSRIFIGGNLSLGLIHISDNQILNTSTIPEQNKISFSSGLSLTLWISKHTFLRLYSNYYLSRFNIDDKTTKLKTFNAGASVALHF